MLANVAQSQRMRILPYAEGELESLKSQVRNGGRWAVCRVREGRRARAVCAVQRGRLLWARVPEVRLSRAKEGEKEEKEEGRDGKALNNFKLRESWRVPTLALFGESTNDVMLLLFKHARVASLHRTNLPSSVTSLPRTPGATGSSTRHRALRRARGI